MNNQPEPFLESVKIAVALRTARAAIGWSQQEFAAKLGVAKSTIARIETVETSPSGSFLVKAMQVLRDAGVGIDLFKGDTVTVQVWEQATKEAAVRLQDEQKRRTDRKKGKDEGTPRGRKKSPS